MSIQSEINRITNEVSTQSAQIGTNAALIEQIKTVLGGKSKPAPVVEKDVNFYDYDGTLLHGYTLAEAQRLTELPPGPEHPGLTFQGWNWDLADVKALTRRMNVGAMYITDDGKTRLHIKIKHSAHTTVPLYFKQTVTDGVTIDWGDGSATETISGSGYVNTSHTYASLGSYVISLDVADGCTVTLGSGNSTHCVLGVHSTEGIIFCNALEAVYIGRNVNGLEKHAFRNCYSLDTVTIPSAVTTIGAYAFYYCAITFIVYPINVTSLATYSFMGCTALKNVSFPIYKNITSFPANLFYMNYNLKECFIPEQTTSLGNGALYCCYALAELTIPDKVNSIAGNALYNAYGLGVLRFKPKTPPIVASTSAFYNLPPNCIVEVPAASLTEYQNATNYSGIAAQMVGV